MLSFYNLNTNLFFAWGFFWGGGMYDDEVTELTCGFTLVVSPL